MKKVTVAATQMSCSWDREDTLKKADTMVREAAKAGAQIILLQELFETPYFCQQHNYDYIRLATKLEENPAVLHFRKLAKELDVVIPVSFFESAGNLNFNSVAVIDADGTIMGVYRKTHIPDGLPYGEKFYFAPGDTGFKVWDTKYAKIGIGICWDQWFPECARSMALQGCELLMYPTAIGTELQLDIDSKDHWQRCMQGHAAANIMPVIASNRIGREDDVTSMTFYGSSFITDETGEKVEEADKVTQTVLTHTFDLDEIALRRRDWGVYRDRRPSMYGTLLTHGKG